MRVSVAAGGPEGPDGPLVGLAALAVGPAVAARARHAASITSLANSQASRARVRSGGAVIAIITSHRIGPLQCAAPPAVERDVIIVLIICQSPDLYFFLRAEVCGNMVGNQKPRRDGCLDGAKRAMDGPKRWRRSPHYCGTWLPRVRAQAKGRPKGRGPKRPGQLQLVVSFAPKSARPAELATLARKKRLGVAPVVICAERSGPSLGGRSVRHRLGAYPLAPDVHQWS